MAQFGQHRNSPTFVKLTQPVSIPVNGIEVPISHMAIRDAVDFNAHRFAVHYHFEDPGMRTMVNAYLDLDPDALPSLP